MLILLIKTRLKYYRNYIRYHFDRTTKIELGLIVLVFLLLIVRSPADIGYNFKWMSDDTFPAKWANIFSICLPIFYILSEAFAWHTLRRSGEWQLIGSLPFGRKSIANYYLSRQFAKLLFFIIIGVLPFWLALTSNLAIRTIRSLAASGVLTLLLLAGFTQAFYLRNRAKPFWRKIIRWIIFELIIISSTILLIPWSRTTFSEPLNLGLLGLLLTWGISFLLLKSIQKSFVLHDTESRSRRGKKSVAKTADIHSIFNFTHGFYLIFIMHDLVYLWRQKRSKFFIPILSIAIALLICFTESDAQAVYLAIIFLELLLSLFFIQTATDLFDRDAEKFSLIRSLPVTTSSLWLQRWLLLFGIIAMPMLVPAIVLLLKHGIDSSFILFLFASWAAIPSVLATIFCNACFGLFPQAKLSGYMISITIIMMILFWFFMPFGTLILLGVMVFWIRKSQKHLQFLEVGA